MAKVDKFAEKDLWVNWVGMILRKHSNNPFKSGLQTGRAMELTVNPYSLKQGFLMDDGTVVDCFRCKLENS
jgi:hypothetical protein